MGTSISNIEILWESLRAEGIPIEIKLPDKAKE